jgi:hypothetical protein
MKEHEFDKCTLAELEEAAPRIFRLRAMQQALSSAQPIEILEDDESE